MKPYSFPGRVRWLAFVGALSLSAKAAAQDAAWLKQNLKPNPSRYEGLLDEPNARREYDVLSFLALPEGSRAVLPQGRPIALHVQICRPVEVVSGAPQRKTAFIEVRQLAGRSNYLMKAEEPPDAPTNRGWQSFAWPTSDVITPNGIDPNRLGVIVHFGQDNEYGEDLAPAYFSASASPPLAPVDRYQLTLRIQGNSLDQLSYQIRTGSGTIMQCYYQAGPDSCAPTKPSAQPLIEAGSLLQLNLNLSKVEPGPVTVQLRGRYHNQDELLETSFHFRHDPVCR